ncbi:hypothetical protein Tco_1006841 [Tanacetum coccineum]|uniref:Uncharacterized protein n=1 Tax=Tanacetum coccineum TaxID=301880 RepID=A0ABQ5FJZ1_9ASTR
MNVFFGLELVDYLFVHGALTCIKRLFATLGNLSSLKRKTRGRVCISSKSHDLISKNVQVEINYELFEATVQEIGSWCIKITDDYIDLSSNDNIKDVDTLSESIDDHSVDDLEYIQTNINNIVNQVFEQKIDNNEENKQGEEDIHLIVPQQPPKEEANNKESNPECKAEFSDLSRPPGFEFMKKVPLLLVNALHHLLDLERKISKVFLSFTSLIVSLNLLSRTRKLGHSTMELRSLIS